MFFLLTIPKKLDIIYYKKFKIFNLIISNNTSPSTELLDRTIIVYMFKSTLGGDCVSKENCAYDGLTTTTLSRRLPMHLNERSFIVVHL